MEMTEEQRSQLGTEWVTVCALREIINVARRGNISSTYRKALALAEDLMPDYFAPEKRLLAGAPESVNARLYRQLAALESSDTGVYITPYQYAHREYEKLSSQIRDNEKDPEDFALAKNRLGQIEACMMDSKPRDTGTQDYFWRCITG